MNEDDVTKIVMNPYYAIQIHPDLATAHEPLVTEEQWIEANTRAIKERGAETWLRELLALLKGDTSKGQATRKL